MLEGFKGKDRASPGGRGRQEDSGPFSGSLTLNYPLTADLLSGWEKKEEFGLCRCLSISHILYVQRTPDRSPLPAGAAVCLWCFPPFPWELRLEAPRTQPTSQALASFQSLGYSLKNLKLLVIKSVVCEPLGVPARPVTCLHSEDEGLLAVQGSA